MEGIGRPEEMFSIVMKQAGPRDQGLGPHVLALSLSCLSGHPGWSPFWWTQFRVFVLRLS